MLKQISEYVGAEYKHGGDIRASILNEGSISIPLPMAPNIANAAAPTPAKTVLQMIFKGQIDAYIKRDAMLEHPEDIFSGARSDH